MLEQAKGRVSIQLQVQLDRAPGYVQRYLLTSGITLHEAAEQIAVGDLRLQRTAAGGIKRG